MITYTVTDTQLSSIADSIRSKAGVYGSLIFPGGFISAVNYCYSTADLPAFDFVTTDTNWSNLTSYIASSAYKGGSVKAVYFPICTDIRQYAFQSCALRYAGFPNCENISPIAFEMCRSLTTVSFPKCITIGGAAFNGCWSLGEVNFPVCTSVGGSAFGGCGALSRAVFPKCTTISPMAFAWCSALSSIHFPKCTYIGGYAFYCCYSLSTASFPKCTTIGSAAFSACTRLVSLYLNGVSSVPTLGEDAFNATPIGGYTIATAGQYGSVFVPSSLYTSFLTATNWSSISARIVSV